VIQITPHMRILVAIEPADFRRGIDGLARICRQELDAEPFSGCLFLFCNRKRTAIKGLVYDGSGFWLCHKRLSKGHFHYWPTDGAGGTKMLESHQVQLLLSGGDPEAGNTAPPPWKRIRTAG
jgi:transposase